MVDNQSIDQSRRRFVFGTASAAALSALPLEVIASQPSRFETIPYFEVDQQTGVPMIPTEPQPLSDAAKNILMGSIPGYLNDPVGFEKEHYGRRVTIDPDKSMAAIRTLYGHLGPDAADAILTLDRAPLAVRNQIRTNLLSGQWTDGVVRGAGKDDYAGNFEFAKDMKKDPQGLDFTISPIVGPEVDKSFPKYAGVIRVQVAEDSKASFAKQHMSGGKPIWTEDYFLGPDGKRDGDGNPPVSLSERDLELIMGATYNGQPIAVDEGKFLRLGYQGSREVWRSVLAAGTTGYLLDIVNAPEGKPNPSGYTFPIHQVANSLYNGRVAENPLNLSHTNLVRDSEAFNARYADGKRSDAMWVIKQ